MVFQVTTAEEFRDKIKSGIVIVDFSATWCGPCKMISPYFDELSKQFTEITFLKVDVDDLEDVSTDAGISAMPTFLVYHNGKVIDQMIGASREKLELLVKKHNIPFK